MTAPFLDTNVLIYTQLDDQRSERAYALMLAGYVIGVQTLNEFANVARRKLGMDWPRIAETSTRLSLHASRVVETQLEDHALSLHLAQRYELSVYDALMLAIALRAGCTTFYSEDLQHGFVVENRMKVLNPF